MTDRIETEALQALVEQVTPGPWTAFNMIHADRGDAMTPEEIGEYVCNSVRKGDLDRFLFVSGKHDDGGTVDICLTGNGPRGPWNTALIAAVPALAAEVLEAREVIPNMGDLIAHYAAQAATAEHWRQVSVDSLVVVTGLRAELKGVKIALEQALASNREREVELEHLRSRTEDRIHDC